jgi:hypothetical protein
MAEAALAFMVKWGSVLGVAFDIVGAVVVYVGVRISFRQAAMLEQIKQVETIDDMGAPDVLMWNSGQAQARARDRVRASRWAGAGLAFFIFGFLLQGIGGWPK